VKAVLLLLLVLLHTASLQGVLAQSLFREEAWRGLTGDNKAFRAGDVLTVQVFENSSASTSADTDTRRVNRLSGELMYGSRASHLALGLGSEFGGGGTTQRASRLLATLSVVVQEVLPGGQLRVAGTQDLTVNDESQKVRLEGVVRPVDITDGNVVQSTRIADARITYVGQGDITERGRRAWWRTLLDMLGF
jgi:flagellar L-ring protein precursor FlgH